MESEGWLEWRFKGALGGFACGLGGGVVKPDGTVWLTRISKENRFGSKIWMHTYCTAAN